jgi:uncharacterized membrane protein
MVNYDTLDKVNFYIELVLSAVSLLVFLLLFFKSGRKLDKSAVFILLAFLFGSIIRIFSSSSNNSLLDTLVPFAGNLTWAGLLHFVFEMGIMHSLLTEESNFKYKLWINKFRIFKITMFSNFILLYCSLNLILF